MHTWYILTCKPTSLQMVVENIGYCSAGDRSACRSQTIETSIKKAPEELQFLGSSLNACPQHGLTQAIAFIERL